MCDFSSFFIQKLIRINVLKGIFIILVHWAVGVGCAVLTGDFIPGSVFGMILVSTVIVLVTTGVLHDVLVKLMSRLRKDV